MTVFPVALVHGDTIRGVFFAAAGFTGPDGVQHADSAWTAWSDSDWADLCPGLSRVPVAVSPPPDPRLWVTSGPIYALIDGAVIQSWPKIARPQAEINAARRAEILTALAEIDAASARPTRAVALGTATQADLDRLTQLEAQAAALRAELADLT